MKGFKKNWLDNKGNVSIMMCLALVGLLTLAAYVVDIGQVYIEKEKLSNGIDAAALAAALELPTNRDRAYTVANEYLVKNNIETTDVNILISEDNLSIEIQATKDVMHLFAPIFGVNQSEIDASNKVIIGPLKSVKGGLRPFAVENFDYQYGDSIILKEGAGDGYHGNYGAVALGGTGVSVLRINIMNGYGGKLSIGDTINTEPGNMASIFTTIKEVIDMDTSTFENFDRDSPRIWSIPIVDLLEVDGSKPVTITGFAQFYIEDVKNKAGQTELIGRFVKYVTNGEIDFEIEDKGSYGVKLSR